MQRVFDAYEAELRKRSVIDYDDLLLHMTNAMRTDRSFAATQRWQFQHFFVDEFQDLNRAQFELLRMWMGGGDDLFVVGDGNQAIYGWNGADASYLHDLERYFPKVETISLHTNYRSSQSVLAAAHTLISDSVDVPEATGIGEPLVVREFVDETAEAEGLARAVRDVHHRNQRWSDIAILVRTNTQRAPIEAALTRLAIPFRSAGGAAWLYEPEVRDALEYLRNSPAAKLNQRAPDIDELIDEAGEQPSAYLFQLQMAIQACLATDATITVADFLSWVEVGSKQDGPSNVGAVSVTSFHRAKGLEWPIVFVAGLESGLVPISNADEDEEKRLFYVALTRARQELHLSWARQRGSGKSAQPRRPSPWLAGVAASSKPLHRKSTVNPHLAMADGRAAVSDQIGQSAERIALEHWRAVRAKLSGIDAKLVLDDRVIDSIIDLRPATRAELADIEGFGPVRAANIGDQLLELLNNE